MAGFWPGRLIYRAWKPFPFLAIGILIVLGFAFFGNPDASFRSSDAKWRDVEVGLKGRHFDIVEADFQSYKSGCSAPRTVLLRTTPVRWYDVFAWPNYFTDRKWRVPYVEPAGNVPNPRCSE
jgi:hypothetical protein